MNRSGLRKMLGAGALLACLGTTAPAYAEGSCPRRVGMGQWSFTETGTIILPTGTIPFGAVGVVTVDARGNVTGTSVASTGVASGGTLSGVFTLNPDCSFTVTTAIHDSEGVLQRHLDFAGVFTDNFNGLHAIVTSLRLPNGAALPAVITLNAERMFSDRWFGR